MSDQSSAARTVLVTGGNRGIGRAIAERFIAAGDNVVVTSRSGGDGPDGAYTVQADVTDTASVNAAFREIEGKFGPVEVLVANAGVTKDTLLVRMKEADFQDVIDTNLTGAFYTAREGVKQMYRRGGAIVLVASTSGIAGRAGQANYAASKGGLIALGKSLAAELAPRGIRVNVVAPGFIDTDMVAGMPPAARTEATAGIPLGRIGSPDDVAAAVTFLAGPGAGYITGKVLTVDGGLVNG